MSLLGSLNRVISLIDMDCFYVQVEERDNPEIKGKPAAVVQYKAYKGGGIIAVNYEARAEGVNRNMRGDEAQAVCPSIILVRVPEARGKADLTKYRNGGSEVIATLKKFPNVIVERASVDEAYVDLTEAVELRIGSDRSENIQALKDLRMEFFENNYFLGSESSEDYLECIKLSEFTLLENLKLAIGAEIVGEMRKAIENSTGFKCSAGIAHNKVLAKLACGINKPNKQTVFPHSAIHETFQQLKVKKVRNLGGKLGDHVVEKLGCETMGDLANLNEKKLSETFGSKTAKWLYALARGFDDEEVTARSLAKSIGCGKNFLGPDALKNKEEVRFWILQFCGEIVERINKDHEMNNRRPKSLTLQVQFEGQGHVSRTCALYPNCSPERMAFDVYTVVKKLYSTYGKVIPIISMGLGVSKFEDEPDLSNYKKINEFFTSKSSSTISNSDLKPSSSTSNSDPKHPISVSNPKPSTSNGPSSKSLKDEECWEYYSEESCPIDDEFNEVILSQHKLKNIPIALANSTNVEKDDENSTVPKSNFSLKVNDKSDSAHLNNSKCDNDVVKTSDEVPSCSKNQVSNELKLEFIGDTNSVDSNNELKSNLFSFTMVRSPVKKKASPKKPAQSFSIECDRCGRLVPTWKIDTHKDFHYARDLQREINGQSPLQYNKETHEVVSSSKMKREDERKKEASTSPVKRPFKRGRPSKNSKGGNEKKGKMKTLDSYFSKS